MHPIPSFFMLSINAVALLATLIQGGALRDQPSDFQLSAHDADWRVVVDGVMGGESTGSVSISEWGSAIFSGEISLENNGGFSQIRTPIEEGSLAGADGVEIRVRGDGRRYIFDLRVSNIRVDASSYQSRFDTEDGRWTTVRLPFSGFRFHAFGEPVPGAPELSPRRIDSLGVTLADKQEGPFELEIAEIRAYDQAESGGDRDGDDPYARRVDDLVRQLGVDQTREKQDGHSDGDEFERRRRQLARELGLEYRSNDRDGESMNAQSQRMVDAAALCELAIARGVPLFNGGQPAACAAVYEVALAGLLALDEQRLGAELTQTVQRALSEGMRQHDATRRAWTYRDALDAVLRERSR